MEASKLQSWYSTAYYIHQRWLDHAKEELNFYSGKQWDDTTKSKLIAQKRPVLTLNYLRSLIRMLVGYEIKTRYELTVLPIDKYGGDDDVAVLLSRLLRFIMRINSSEYVFGDAYKFGLITGRGWIGTDIDYSRNILGDPVLRSEDVVNIVVDPLMRRLDMKDAKYLFVDKWLTEDDIKYLYPKLDINDISLVSTSANVKNLKKTISGITYYNLREAWYKEYKVEKYLIDRETYEIIRTKDESDEELNKYVQGGKYILAKKTIPQIYYSVLAGNQILEEGKSPYSHEYYPYVLYTCEFLPAFMDVEPDWVGLLRDLLDPQREINKRRSQWLDALIRTVNPGLFAETTAVKDWSQLEKSMKEPGTIVELNEGGIGKIKEKPSMAPNPALYTTGVDYVNDILRIGNINPAMLGFAEGSRESGKSILARQQAGNVSIAQYQDNFRLTRLVVAKIMLSMIPQVFTPARIARAIAGDGKLQSLDIGDVNAIRKLIETLDLDRYDVAFAEAPVTPSQRVAEFVELKEIITLMIQLGMPPTPQLIAKLVEASDVSQKRDVINLIQQAARQAEQAQQQAPPIQ